jgi:hypothetical protein
MIVGQETFTVTLTKFLTICMVITDFDILQEHDTMDLDTSMVGLKIQ